MSACDHANDDDDGVDDENDNDNDDDMTMTSWCGGRRYRSRGDVADAGDNAGGRCHKDDGTNDATNDKEVRRDDNGGNEGGETSLT